MKNIYSVIVCAFVAACSSVAVDDPPGPKPTSEDGGGGQAPQSACTPTTCSGHGTCSAASGTPVCTCEKGYGGVDCRACAVGSQDKDGNKVCAPACSSATCSGHGTCNDSTGTAACVCSAGYGGANCETCAAGFQDKDGNKVCLPSCAAGSCSGHGTCSDANGTVNCTCDAGYGGPACATCASNFQDKDKDGLCKPACAAATCSGNGTCADSTGTAVCTCAVNFSGPACASCAPGFTGAACDTCVAGKFGPRCDYDPLYGLNIPLMADWNTAGQVPYDVDNSGVAGAFTRVAYRLQLDAEEVWVEMNAFTATKSQLGVPADVIFDSTAITNVTVVSKAANVTNVSVPTSGTLEFWSNCYGTNGGNNSLHDYKDSILPASPDCYGSMQIHIGTNTVFAYNRWSGGGNADIGFGNRPTGNPDWTEANNAGSFTTRRLEVFIK